MSANDPLLAQFPGAELVVRIEARHIFGNCPRYVPRLQLVEASEHLPRTGYTPPIPEWKTRPLWREVLPVDDPALGTGPDSVANPPVEPVPPQE